jgi:hypothetical protein
VDVPGRALLGGEDNGRGGRVVLLGGDIGLESYRATS